MKRLARFKAICQAAARFMAHGVLAAWLLMSVEWLVVLISAGAQLVSVWEIQYGSLWLAPSALAGLGVAGLLGGLFRWLITNQGALSRSFAAALAGACGFAIAWGVGGGRLLASALRRGGLAALVGILAGVGVWLLAPYIRREIQRRPWLVSGTALGLIFGLSWVNAVVLVRLYPAFHLGLSAICCVLAAFLFNGPQREQVEPPPPKKTATRAGRHRFRYVPAVIGLVWVSSALLITQSAQRLARFDNFRMVMLERALFLKYPVQLAAWFAPPPPIQIACEGAACWEEEALGSVSDEARANAGLDWRNLDILLVSVDALRADHVGAYGYQRPTTPKLDELANGEGAYDGVVFDWAYCPTPHTSYSITSLMTGKYMRPLLLQGSGLDSDTFASLLRTYEYRTAAFYPPAIFFIDKERFKPFEEQRLGFEYTKQEFLEGEPRVQQFVQYLDQQPASQRVFSWVHLFGPHEPYESHPGLGFGERDIDRYDSEIAAVDRTIGRLTEELRKRRPNSVVIVTADHGEEFGEHGGRYHGTSVYEEQVRVPLIMSIPRGNSAEATSVPRASTRRVHSVVQTIDLLPTLLGAIDVPIPPRVRGRDLAPLVHGAPALTAAEAKVSAAQDGFALVETDNHILLAEGMLRLICERRVGACQLFDLTHDPLQQKPLSDPEKLSTLRNKLRQLSASHGKFEQTGKRAEGGGWPEAILRGMSGDGDAAEEIASLLDDADVEIRRKAAELLFNLRRPETAQALELALRRDEDIAVKNFSALALTRLGHGAPLSFELARSSELSWRRLAALALAETGDRRGEADLVAWWKKPGEREFERSRELLQAFAELKSKDAVWPLVQSLDDVRLRPEIAKSLAEIGDEVARVPLAKALAAERYQSARLALAEALLELGAEAELANPLIRFLGVPDPLMGGVGIAIQAGILDRIGGPTERELKQLTQQSELGVGLLLVVPKGGNGRGVRAVVRARSRDGGHVYIAPEQSMVRYNSKGEPLPVKDAPRLDRERATLVEVPASESPVESWATLAAHTGATPGKPVRLVVFAERQVELLGLALVPLADELPPPAPKPWKPGQESGAAQPPIEP